MKLYIRKYNEPKETNIISISVVSNIQQIEFALAEYGKTLRPSDVTILRDKIAKLDFYSIFI